MQSYVIQNSKVLLYTETATNIIRDLNPFLWLNCLIQEGVWTCMTVLSVTEYVVYITITVSILLLTKCRSEQKLYIQSLLFYGQRILVVSTNKEINISTFTFLHGKDNHFNYMSIYIYIYICKQFYLIQAIQFYIAQINHLSWKCSFYFPLF